MIPHPSDSELDAFIRRTPSPTELIAIDGHLNRCPQCRARMETRMDIDRSIAWLKAEVGSSLRKDHLSEETIVSLADGEVIPEATDHLRTCVSCRSELEDVVKFAAANRPPVANRSLRIWAVAAAILIAVLAPLFWIWTQRAPHQEIAAGLRDAGGSLTLDGNGNLHSNVALPPDYSAIVGQSLRSGQLDIGGVAAGLGRKQEVLLGGAPSENRFALNHPFAESVLTGRPQFSWQPLAGASSYRVEVYDEEFRKVGESPNLTSTTWTPAEPLPGGHVYSWTVTAHMGSKEVREPVPPSPEAKFGVLPPDEVERLSDARSRFPNAHLLLAALYARAGALEQARAELKILESANPGSAFVTQLKKSLDAKP